MLNTYSLIIITRDGFENFARPEEWEGRDLYHAMERAMNANPTKSVVPDPGDVRRNRKT